jgi:hypothetical protein
MTAGISQHVTSPPDLVLLPRTTGLPICHLVAPPHAKTARMRSASPIQADAVAGGMPWPLSSRTAAMKSDKARQTAARWTRLLGSNPRRRAPRWRRSRLCPGERSRRQLWPLGVRGSAAGGRSCWRRRGLRWRSVDLGAALRRAGRRAAARSPLREALHLAVQGGAAALASAARVELLASGARPRRDEMRGRMP